MYSHWIMRRLLVGKSGGTYPQYYIHRCGLVFKQIIHIYIYTQTYLFVCVYICKIIYQDQDIKNDVMFQYFKDLGKTETFDPDCQLSPVFSFSPRLHAFWSGYFNTMSTIIGIYLQDCSLIACFGPLMSQVD